MKTRVLSSTEKRVVQATPGLSSYLHALEAGRPATPHSWLYEDEDSAKTLERWRETLDPGLRKLGEFGKECLQLENNQVAKFGPMGEIPPINKALETLKPNFERSETPLPKLTKMEFGEGENFRLASALFRPRILGTLQPRSYRKVVQNMRERDTLETNSGWPLFTRRSKSQVINESILDAISGRAYEYPAITLFRSYYGKLRPVWIYPMSMNIIEGSFAQVIQDAIQNVSLFGDCFTPWLGFEYVKKSLTYHWSKTGWAVSGDTTAMDANFKKDQTEIVYNVVKYAFDRRYWEELRKCMMHVNDIPVVVGPDTVWYGEHGVASGSVWTQLLETVYQFIIWYKTFMVSDDALLDEHLSAMFIGDDLIWTFPIGFIRQNPVLKQQESTANILADYGLPANPTKQHVSNQSAYFLQRLFWKGFMSREDSSVLGGVYPTIRALNSLLNPERFHNPETWNSDMFCVRTFMILENVVDHPLFPEFVKFVCHGQKDLIPFAKQTAQQIDKAANTARLLARLVPTYNREKREKPLSTFQSVHLASEM